MTGSCGRLGELGGKQAASVEPFLDTSQRLRRKDGNGFSGTNPVTHLAARQTSLAALFALPFHLKTYARRDERFHTIWCDHHTSAHM